MDNTYSEYGDIKIICVEDCGNSPKKKLLKELNIAFAENDIGFIMENITEDVYWNLIGEKLIQGKDNFVETLKQMKNRKVTEIHIRNIITHGSTGAVNGTYILEDKNSYAFCDIYNFTSAGKNSKIKEITSYIIEAS
ncbi:nuclear transport factor 2 family protein [Halalkalibacter lacteus]|uniref:nuclear transport factor 2 family protein n=1 Tax=Halalkalibacter lacteus TaxID=3090663 RepID=UPI002FC77131